MNLLTHLQIIGEGHTTKVYRDGNRAFKMYVRPPPGEVENEARRQQIAYDTGLPVPEVFGVHTYDNGAQALEMAYIPGNPLMRKGMNAEDRRQAIERLCKL